MEREEKDLGSQPDPIERDNKSKKTFIVYTHK